MMFEGSEYKSCEECHILYLTDPYRIYTKCRACKEEKEPSVKPLCTRCYVAAKERDKKEREIREGRS